MKIIHILITITLLCGVSSAYHDYSDDKEILYLYGDSKDTIKFDIDILNRSENPNKTVCVNTTCVSGWMKNYIPYNYILEYDFTYKVNDSYYKTVVVRIEQEVVRSTWFTNYVNRSLQIDGHEVATTKNRPVAKYTFTKPLMFTFSYPDRTVSLDDTIVNNQTLMFTELDMSDQNFVISYYHNIQGTSKYPFIWNFETIPEDGDTSLKLKGLSAIFVNILNDIPFVGKSIGNIIYMPLLLFQYVFVGKSIGNIIYMPLLLFQYVLNFLFTFIKLIINDWWYALVLLEIICIIPALQYNSFPELVGTYIDMHVKVVNFMLHKVILPLIRLILKVVEMIRNLIPFI